MVTISLNLASVIARGSTLRAVCRPEAGYELRLASLAPTTKVLVLYLRQNQMITSAALGQFGVKV
jgi:hypothetical protein